MPFELRLRPLNYPSERQTSLFKRPSKDN
jgi:hypothetical protein